MLKLQYSKNSGNTITETKIKVAIENISKTPFKGVAVGFTSVESKFWSFKTDIFLMLPLFL